MTGMNAVANALLKPQPDLPKMDLVGPTADDDVRRAIGRYGVEAVKAAIKKQTAGRRGRPRLPDWKELQPVIEADARLWLEGGDPFAARSIYSIAKEYADAKPGHSHPATMQRIERKLRKEPYGRRWFTLVIARELSDTYPYAAHVRTLKALSELTVLDLEPATIPMWQWSLERAEGYIADYARIHGAPPADDLTMQQVEEGARTPLEQYLGTERFQPAKPGGMFGLLAPPRENTLAALAARYAQSPSAGE